MSCSPVVVVVRAGRVAGVRVRAVLSCWRGRGGLILDRAVLLVSVVFNI